MKLGTLFTASGFCKRLLLPGAPKMLWVDTITYGAIGPLWLGKGEDHVGQRAEAMKQHDSGDTGGFYLGLGR